MVAPAEALAAIPETLDDIEAAPLLALGLQRLTRCGNSGALPGDLVAIQGIGGLGHLGIQFASKFGYKVAAIGRGAENRAAGKETRSQRLHRYQLTNAAEALQSWAAHGSSWPPHPTQKLCPN